MSEPFRLAVCPGSFDPFTNGHLDMVRRASRLFDRVIVAVLVNSSKQPLFPVAERLEMIRESVIGTPNVDIDTFGGLLADYVRDRKATTVVRGVRTGSELSEEWPSAMMNRQLYDEFETVFLIPSIDVAHISSRLVREIARLGGSVDGLVPAPVARRLATLGRPRTTDRV